MLKALTLSVALLIAAVARAAPPADPAAQIPYTGYLQLNAVPANASVQLTVTLYDQANKIWTDTLPTVSVTNGRFSVVLGSRSGDPIPAGYLNGSLGSGKPLQLEIAVGTIGPSGSVVNNTVLSPRQTLYAAPYAVASASANHSATDFNVNGALSVGGNTTIGGNTSISGALSVLGNVISFLASGDQPNGIAYRPSKAPDALAISGAGTTVGSRLIRLFDNVIVNGNLTLTGGGLTPSLDTGWFTVHSNPADNIPPTTNSPAYNTPYHDANGNIVIQHNFGAYPSQIMVQSCGTSDDLTCGTYVVLSGPTGYHDSGVDINPNTIYTDSNNLYLGMTHDWYAFGYYQSNAGIICGVSNNYCYQARYRVLLWR